MGGGKRKMRHTTSPAQAARGAVVFSALLAAAIRAQSSGTGACDKSQSATTVAASGCCQPTPGYYCVEIQPTYFNNATTDGTTTGTAVSIADNYCMWNNLAGQTPDSTQAYNTGLNDFLCADDSCNGADVATIQSSTSSYYAAYIPASHFGSETSIMNGTVTASTYYANFNVALSRYNCEEQYSHWNCDDCRKAYARWACAMTMPQCYYSTAQGGCMTIKPHVRVCNEVVQKCPVTLGFTCPDDNRDYTDSGGNLMGLTSGVGSGTTISLLAATASLAVLGFARH